MPRPRGWWETVCARRGQEVTEADFVPLAGRQGQQPPPPPSLLQSGNRGSSTGPWRRTLRRTQAGLLRWAQRMFALGTHIMSLRPLPAPPGATCPSRLRLLSVEALVRVTFSPPALLPLTPGPIGSIPEVMFAQSDARRSRTVCKYSFIIRRR